MRTGKRPYPPISAPPPLTPIDWARAYENAPRMFALHHPNARAPRLEKDAEFGPSGIAVVCSCGYRNVYSARWLADLDIAGECGDERSEPCVLA